MSELETLKQQFDAFKLELQESKLAEQQMRETLRKTEEERDAVALELTSVKAELQQKFKTQF